MEKDRRFVGDTMDIGLPDTHFECRNYIASVNEEFHAALPGIITLR